MFLNSSDSDIDVAELSEYDIAVESVKKLIGRQDSNEQLPFIVEFMRTLPRDTAVADVCGIHNLDIVETSPLKHLASAVLGTTDDEAILKLKTRVILDAMVCSVPMVCSLLFTRYTLTPYFSLNRMYGQLKTG